MKRLFLESAKLSTWAYLEPEEIKKKLRPAGFRNFAWIENEKTDTQCFVCSKGEHMFVTFRGSSTDEDWQTNFDIALVSCKFGLVHKGFKDDVRSVYFSILGELPKHIIKGRKLIITGHSQGAGDAVCMAVEMLEDFREIEAVVTFGGPRVVDSEAADYLDGLGIFHRFVNNNDLVTRIAPRLFGYKHFGKLHYFREDGTYTDDISAWGRFLDRLSGKFDFGGPYRLDILNDHMPERYLALVEQIA